MRSLGNCTPTRWLLRGIPEFRASVWTAGHPPLSNIRRFMVPKQDPLIIEGIHEYPVPSQSCLPSALKTKSLVFRAFLLSWVLLLSAQLGFGAVYQYAVKFGTRGIAFLWIPEKCTYVRGIIWSMQNLMERNWLEDPIVRRAAADEGLAIVYVAGKDPSITWEMQPESVEATKQLFDKLAQESGYHELSFAPIIWMGHSFHGRTWLFARAMPERTLAAIPIRTYPLPESLGFTGIPVCYIVGQTTELPQYNDGRPGDRDFFWPVVRDTALALRAAAQNNLVGVVAYPGGTHTDWDNSQACFVALLLHKICQFRLPNERPRNGPVKLNTLAPEDGWLTDSGLLQPDRFAPAPFQKYRGDPKKAFWFFDRETALAAVAFNGARRPREKQMVTFVQDGKPLPVKPGLSGAELKFEPEADGLTFEVEGGFLSEIPEGLIGAGTKLGHATSGSFKFRKIAGPVAQTGPDTFRIQFDGQNLGTELGGALLMVEHAGDERYRRAVQPMAVQFPARLTVGKPQVLTFPKLSDQSAGMKSVELRATSDSGLPVDYYVVAGPAEVDGNKLKIVQLPAKSRFPVRVTVVAYQWGRTVEPLYRSAEPVEQTFSLLK